MQGEALTEGSSSRTVCSAWATRAVIKPEYCTVSDGSRVDLMATPMREPGHGARKGLASGAISTHSTRGRRGRWDCRNARTAVDSRYKATITAMLQPIRRTRAGYRGRQRPGRRTSGESPTVACERKEGRTMLKTEIGYSWMWGCQPMTRGNYDGEGATNPLC